MVDHDESNSVWDTYRERGVSEEQIAILKKQVLKTSGYEVDSELTSLGFQFTTELKNFEYAQMSYVLTLFQQWDKGHMPFTGAITDQPNKIIEIMNLIGNLKAEYMDKSRKKQEQQMKRSSK